MNVLILGSGGREHALCDSIHKSSQVNNLYVIPGNPGMASIATCIDLNPLNNTDIVSFAIANDINLIIPGSEVYLENGITDAFSSLDVFVFGPTKYASQIESSKEFAKDLLNKYKIPTATYKVYRNFEEAKQYIDSTGTPIVIKYDGLAGGKGVVVALTEKEALDALTMMLVEKKYGSSHVIIEEYLEGPEFSLMCFVHNGTIIPMPIAQDHKRLLDNDQGPNTGGMGIYSPVPIIPDYVIEESIEKIMQPTVDALLKEGVSYTGFLYGGLMLTTSGPKVIEFNARFGDPEAEVILPKLQSDFLDVIINLKNGIKQDLIWDDKYVVGVVLASKGYPLQYEKGHMIQGLDAVNEKVYHMGTKLVNKNIHTNGGRVLLVKGIADTLEEAREEAYQNITKIQCDNLIFRTDIGMKSLMK